MRTGKIGHDVTAGGEVFLRSVQQPGFYTIADPYSPDGVVQDGAVYTYVGSDNIYQPVVPLDLSAVEDPHQSAGPRRLWVDSHQAAAILQDRIHLPGRIQLLAAGRYVSLRDHNYLCLCWMRRFFRSERLRAAVHRQAASGCRNTQLLSIQSKTSRSTEIMVCMLSLGPQGPFWTDNGSQFLAPFRTRQAEIGAKYQPTPRILLTTALFRMHAPFLYPKTLEGADTFCPSGVAGDQCFESEGREAHNGIEVNAEGKAANWLRLTGSVAAMRATSSDTGTPAFDNKQVINVPHLHTALFADLLVPHARGLHLMPGWGYTGRKEATRDDAVSVSGYNLFNLGARYTPGGELGRVTFRLYADNITDKRYWKDTGASLGDTFIHLGAPTTVRLSAHYTF